MSEERNNPTMELIKKRFNEISQKHLGGEMCQL